MLLLNQNLLKEEKIFTSEVIVLGLKFRKECFAAQKCSKDLKINFDMKIIFKPTNLSYEGVVSVSIEV